MESPHLRPFNRTGSLAFDGCVELQRAVVRGEFRRDADSFRVLRFFHIKSQRSTRSPALGDRPLRKALLNLVVQQLLLLPVRFDLNCA
jgi:hypothetical protein